MQYHEIITWAEACGRKYDPGYFFINAANRKIDFYQDFEGLKPEDLLEKGRGLKGTVYSFDGDRLLINTSNGPLYLDDLEQLLEGYANKAEVTVKVKRLKE